MLEVSENHVKRKITTGVFRVGARGSWNRPLIELDDVQQYARAKQLGKLGRHQRVVYVVGSLEDADLALRVSGLVTKRYKSLMQALAFHDVRGAPIIVAAPSIIRDEFDHLRDMGVLHELHSIMHLAIVSPSQTCVPWTIEKQSAIFMPDEPRALVVWAWKALEQRSQAGALDL